MDQHLLSFDPVIFGSTFPNRLWFTYDTLIAVADVIMVTNLVCDTDHRQLFSYFFSV